jgi:chromate transporter
MKQAKGSAAEVLLVFLRLGCTSFGGPIAHLGYFQKELVERRGWCSEATLGEIIGIAQSLPGPASSQTGFALGIFRAGWLGGLAAFLGFTLPSALLMLAFAYGHSLFAGGAGSRVLHGLGIVAVAVVAQAVMAMRRSLAPDRVRSTMAVVAAAITLFADAQFSTLIAIAAGAAAGLWVFRNDEAQAVEHPPLPLSKMSGMIAAGGFAGLLLLLPVLAHSLAVPGLGVFSAFYQSGALVFGGGHVVLPLLENAVVARGWVTQESFLAGYGAAQALPGPLFSLAAYLGAVVRPTASPLLYGLLALVGIFAPGLLAMTAVLPWWSALRDNRPIQAALRGINASVVGVLIAALYRPLWVGTIHNTVDFWLALCAFALLTVWKVQPWVVVAGIAGISILQGYW